MVQSSKNPLDIIYDYPPKIVKRVEEMGLVGIRKRKTSNWLNHWHRFGAKIIASGAIPKGIWNSQSKLVNN